MKRRWWLWAYYVTTAVVRGLDALTARLEARQEEWS